MSSPVSRRATLFTGLDCHYLEWDVARSAHTVVLVHGFLDLGWGWARTVEAGLAERYHVVAPDVRGHGDSARAGAGGYYHIMDYVADLAALLKQVARGRVSLVGHSMGGSIVSYAAGCFPDRVDRLALLEGVGPPEDETPVPDRVTRWIGAWEQSRLREPTAHDSLEAAAERLQHTDPLLDPEQALWLAEKSTVELPDGSRRFKHDALHVTRGPYPFRREVMDSFHSRVTCPVLLVDGGLSHFRPAPEEAERIRRLFVNAQATTLEGAGHMMTRHRPADLARLLVDFLGT
jgi:pimeloyl-ACP methyl ester carboxylesterase